MSDLTQDQPIGRWLDALASKRSTPGGGAAAALLAAQGAALVGMVTELTIGRPAYAAHEQAMAAARDRAAALRAAALSAADADARAFDAVMAAYQLPKATDEDRIARTAAVQAALADAAAEPLALAGLAGDVIGLAAAIEPGANVNVLSDVAVAAQCARAALDAAAINVEINLAALTDPDTRTRLRQDLDKQLPALAEADRIIAAVRERISR